VADGLHMSTHVAALSIAAIAYSFARRHVANDWFSFGTGKVGELAAFTSAIILAMVALLIAFESVVRFINPVEIAYREAIPIAVLGLAVNLISAFLLHDSDDHHHDHAHEDPYDVAHDHAAADPDDHDYVDEHDPDHDHHHDHDHHDDHSHDVGHRADFNIRAAYVHVLADAVTSLLAISALAAGAYFDLPWFDAAAGLLGTIVIAAWAYSLVKSASAVLLDAVPSRARAVLIRQRLEVEGDRVTDFHLWRLGPGHLGVLAVIVTERPRAPDYYKARLEGIEGLSHVNIEVNPYPGTLDVVVSRPL
jgi:cation diffusion facilitator family transporter